jgi:hypothetical protein
MGAEVRVTNDAGAYRVPSLPPGLYTVKIEAPSFQTMTRADIVLTAGAVLGVDFVLKLSTLEETVTVTGESPLVDVKSTQINRTIENAALEYLPVGRSFGELIVTAPGVIDSEYTFQPSQTVHGSTVRDNVFNLDGAVINDNVVGYMLSDISYDIIEEVQVTSGGISAEYARPAARSSTSSPSREETRSRAAPTTSCRTPIWNGATSPTSSWRKVSARAPR